MSRQQIKTMERHYRAVVAAIRNLPLSTRKALHLEATELGWISSTGKMSLGFHWVVLELSDLSVTESVDHILDLAGLNAIA